MLLLFLFVHSLTFVCLSKEHFSLHIWCVLKLNSTSQGTFKHETWRTHSEAFNVAYILATLNEIKFWTFSQTIYSKSHRDHTCAKRKGRSDFECCGRMVSLKMEKCRTKHRKHVSALWIAYIQYRIEWRWCFVLLTFGWRVCAGNCE